MYPLTIFLATSLFFLSWVQFFHTLLPFNSFEYRYNANHYIKDPRIANKSFSLINALGQYDSQWYLKIAEAGYPDHPSTSIKESRGKMEGLLYNFFPLYPILIGFFNLFIRHVEVSGFVTSSLLLLASSYSLYFMASKWFSKVVAKKTLLLFLLYPFSVFLHGYYAEGLRLFLFLWLCFALTEKKFLLGALCVGLLCVTSGISIFLLPFYFGILVYFYFKKKISLFRALFAVIVMCLPFCLWIFYVFIHTGDPFFFVKTRAAWIRPQIPPILYNIGLIISFPSLAVRAMYGSRIDVLCIILTLCLTYLSRNVLPKIVWLATIVLAFTPLFLQDSVSFARFTSVLFPFFIYIAAVLKKPYYFALLGVFMMGLLVVSLFYVNWYWIE